MKGLTDKPAVLDAFQIESYINGLCDFITTCTAPITISIQGDWGTGKTSIMQMTKNKLGANIHKVWFNTWQFSQFNMGEQLPILFMTKLINEIEDHRDSSKSKTKEILGMRKEKVFSTKSFRCRSRCLWPAITFLTM